MPTAYTDVDEIKGVVEVDEETYDDDKLEAFIEASSYLIQDIVKPAYDPPASSGKLKAIHTYLAAHLYSVSDPREISAWVGTVRVFYEYKVGLHLNLTRFGQQAQLMDTSGALAAFNNRLMKANSGPLAGEGVSVTFWALNDAPA